MRFGSGCLCYNPFGLENSTQSGSKHKPNQIFWIGSDWKFRSEFWFGLQFGFQPIPKFNSIAKWIKYQPSSTMQKWKTKVKCQLPSVLNKSFWKKRLTNKKIKIKNNVQWCTKAPSYWSYISKWQTWLITNLHKHISKWQIYND